MGNSLAHPSEFSWDGRSLESYTDSSAASESGHEVDASLASWRYDEFNRDVNKAIEDSFDSAIRLSVDWRDVHKFWKLRGVDYSQRFDGGKKAGSRDVVRNGAPLPRSPSWALTGLRRSKSLSSLPHLGAYQTPLSVQIVSEDTRAQDPIKPPASPPFPSDRNSTTSDEDSEGYDSFYDFESDDEESESTEEDSDYADGILREAYREGMIAESRSKMAELDQHDAERRRSATIEVSRRKIQEMKREEVEQRLRGIVEMERRRREEEARERVTRMEREETERRLRAIAEMERRRREEVEARKHAARMLREEEERRTRAKAEMEAARLIAEMMRQRREEEETRERAAQREREEAERRLREIAEMERQRREEKEARERAAQMEREEEERRAKAKAEREAARLRADPDWQTTRRKDYISKQKQRILDRQLEFILLGDFAFNWTPLQAWERYKHTSEAFDAEKFGSEPGMNVPQFDSLPWPTLKRPTLITLEDVEWNGIEEFFNQMRLILPLAEYKALLAKSHKRFHPDRWKSRGVLSGVKDEVERDCLEYGANVVSQAITPLWRASACM